MKAALVKIDVAAAALGWSVSKIFDLADGGSLLDPPLLWVFDLASRPDLSRRDLRFWLGEINERAPFPADPAQAPDRIRCSLPLFTLDDVLDLVLPICRQHFHAGEVDQLFQIRSRTRIDLHPMIYAGQKIKPGPNRHNFYPRDLLAGFLRRRWCGQPAPIQTKTLCDIPT